MKFRIAGTFTDWFGKSTGHEQTVVETTLKAEINEAIERRSMLIWRQKRR